MGIFMMVAWVMSLIAAVLLIIQRLPDPAFAWALRLGLLLSLVGAGIGFLMTDAYCQRSSPRYGPARPIAAQSARIASASSDGGPGLPLTGWSTTGGDLRVGHFVGLHALQACRWSGGCCGARASGGWAMAIVWRWPGPLAWPTSA